MAEHGKGKKIKDVDRKKLKGKEGMLLGIRDGSFFLVLFKCSVRCWMCGANIERCCENEIGLYYRLIKGTKFVLRNE